MRWIPLLLIFIVAYIEITLVVQVAHVIGVLFTLLLIVLTSFIGVSLVRTQGVKILGQMQVKIANGESPAVEMIKSVSVLLAGFLLLLPGFFTDFLGLLLLLPPVQNSLTLKLLPYLRFQRGAAGGFGPGDAGGDTFEGEFKRKDIPRDAIEHRSEDDK
ncbi:FxsA family protein [Acerihabitans sp.]|uniref:FxsA family protein n=1 Tax=Acerihabitans sp. TaxID=2811394 RepID=UPI002EDAB9E4